MEDKFAELIELLESNEELAAVVRHDLWAIQNEQPTIGVYNLLEWYSIKGQLGELEEGELERLIGPPPENSSRPE